MVTSHAQLDEFKRVFTYERIEKRLAPEQAAAFFKTVVDLAQVVDPRTDIDVSPDPDDNIIIGTAVAGEARFLVTGDKHHLLSLKSPFVESVMIVTARQAVDIITRFPSRYPPLPDTREMGDSNPMGSTPF